MDEGKRIRETSTADHIILTPEQEELQFNECMAINDEWNKATGKFRDERILREKSDKLKYAQERLALKEERDRERMETAEELVRLEKVNVYLYYSLRTNSF